jgi:arabinan endo-1,5-alpha-L-arabinosidase
MKRRGFWRNFSVAMAALLMVAVAAPGAVAQTESRSRVYDNPLEIQIPGDGLVESCADPTIIKGQTVGDDYWYMYCTTDPLNSQDRDPAGNFIFHLIPMLRSLDLVNWTYMGDAFADQPAWLADNAGMWAPEIQYFNGLYYLYYTATDTDLYPGSNDSAIGVATSTSPLGPWTDSGAPVVEPHAPACCPNDFRWVFDPEVVQDEVTGQRYIFYGSYFGGISARELSADGLHSNPATQVQITISNKYEGAEVEFHDGYYYLFVSATDCCRGPLTGYSVYVGRSQTLLGPYVDKEGHTLLEGRTGGTVVISMNGNRWVGTGHNDVFMDFDGQWWTVYHAIDQYDPYFEGAVGFTKRPVLLDAIDWIDGWPTVRGGLWASDTPQQAPAAQPGQHTNYNTPKPREDVPRELLTAYSDEFNGATLSGQWSWVRQPAAGTYGLEGGTFRFNTQAADLFEGSNNASVLIEDAPDDNYMVETRVRLNVPAEGCCFNYTQAGLVIYANDDNYVKLAHVSIWETRQTEFAKEVFPVPAGYPRYGNTVVGPPGEWTYLRIVRRISGGQEHYTAYTSSTGEIWTKGGTWTHALGTDAKIGLVSMGGAGFVANFDYVRVYTISR